MSDSGRYATWAAALSFEAGLLAGYAFLQRSWLAFAAFWACAVMAASALYLATHPPRELCRCGCGRTLVNSDGPTGFAFPCQPKGRA